MRLLVLGGGGFLGYHVAAQALGDGHDVTTFSRDEAAPVTGAEHLVGDREDDISSLEDRGRKWDGVLDTFSGAEAVSRTARLLSGRVGSYGYVSGISVYDPSGPDVVDEGSPLRKEGENDGDPLQDRSVAKLECEEAVRSSFDGNAFIVRPGIMVGPRDPTDRFTWWPVRYLRALEEAAETGAAQPILAPGDPDRDVQYTDARDLGRWIPKMLFTGESGTYNAVGPAKRPDGSATAREALSGCFDAACRVYGSRGGVSPDALSELAGKVETVWAGEGFLREHLGDVAEEERPLWMPEDQIPFARVNSLPAFESGLRFRAAAETAADTLAWRLGEDEDANGLLAGFSRGREEGLIAGWRAARGSG